jgi:hypothetical protein
MNINGNYNSTTEEILESIKSIDDKLSIAREGWNDSPIDKKSKWMDTINQLLDDRCLLMRMRDKYCS